MIAARPTKITKKQEWGEGMEEKGEVEVGERYAHHEGPEEEKEGRRTWKGGPEKAPGGPRESILLDVPGAALREASWEHLGGALLEFSRTFLELYLSPPKASRGTLGGPRSGSKGDKMKSCQRALP